MVTMRGYSILLGQLAKSFPIEFDAPLTESEQAELRIVKSINAGQVIEVGNFKMDSPEKGTFCFTTNDDVVTGTSEVISWVGKLENSFLNKELKQIRGDITRGNTTIGTFYLEIGNWQ
ncbi:hypothetical protein ACFLXG_03110 [Chloroflexota bacterium]